MNIEEAREKLKVLHPRVLVMRQKDLNKHVDSMTDEQALEAAKLQEAVENLTEDDLNDWAVAFLKQTAN